MKRISEVSVKAENALWNYENTRNSDNELFLAICKEINPGVLNLPFEVVMSNFNTFGLPAFESVSRARRKIQNNNPELRANKTVEDFRYENYKDIKEYALQ